MSNDELNKQIEELKLLPDSVYKNVQMGIIFSRLNQEDEAFSCFEKVIIEEPSNIEALEGLLRIYNNSYSKRYNVQKAGEIAERILSIDKNNFLANEILPNTNKRDAVIIDSYNEDGITDIIRFVKRIDYLGLITFLLNIIILIFLIGIFSMPLFFRNNDARIARNTNIENSEEIEINPLSDMDRYSKNDVFDLRKWYLYHSMFSSSDYTPSEDVFGRIKDGKYWYGTKHFICFDGQKGTQYRAEGDSFISMWINNPSYLVAVNTPYAYNIPDDDAYMVCKDDKMLFIPKSINYNKDLNMITVTLNTDKIVTNARDLYYMLIGINAIDLGYKWGYVFNSQNITFRNQNTAINRRLYMFRDFLAVCGLTPDCNHLCSVQHDLEFQFSSNDNALIDLKLWKEQPVTSMKS